MGKILGIEFGSTRIKAVLIDENANVLAKGIYNWENQLVDGFWTYSQEEIIKGLQESYKDLVKNYGKPIEQLDSIGISGMMHGYLPFDEKWNLLAAFRTWRNTNTGEAADVLSELFKFNVPMRWSVSHYLQAIINKEEHIDNIAHLTTLAGYIGFLLSGSNFLGIGEASGMFPIKGETYDETMLCKFDEYVKKQYDKNVPLVSLLPLVKLAGEKAGTLSESGAKLLDPSGTLKPGAIICPPEGDASTGMVATNSVLPKTANISAGTSAFLMVVLENDLKGYYKEIDVVTTPMGKQVAMVHVNNFTTDFNKWFDLFNEVATMAGGKITLPDLFNKSLESDENVGDLLSYGFYSGEPIVNAADTKLEFYREANSKMNVANFMQNLIYSSLCSIAIGMDILRKEGVKVDAVCGQGGFFNTPFVGQNAMSAALKCPVSVMKNSTEGGAWGMAVLALYALQNEKHFDDFMNEVFAENDVNVVEASDNEKDKFDRYLEKYKRRLGC